VCRVFGYFVDITDASRCASEADIHDAVEKSAATRAVIEQAKGALMAVQGVSAENAFALLRWHSSRATSSSATSLLLSSRACPTR
jgi:AmiR/NasT family two-component response regulator